MILNDKYVEKLTDEELCMLEQLTYLDEDVAIAAEIDKDFTKINSRHKGSSINDILEFFDEEALNKLKKHGEPVGDAVISGVEWARIIEYLKTSRLQYLVLDDMMMNDNNYHSVVYDADQKKYVPISEFRESHTEVTDDELGKYDIMRIPLALCFTDGSEKTDEAIIAYKGTTGPDEWADNVFAGYNYSSPPQEAALEFANDMVRKGFTKLTVTGHSKGSNKAMFVTILCNNVIRCVSFDGEGFSEKFLRDEETIDKIRKRASLITNYSLSSDFVHILLYQIPGSNQIYCKGYGVEGVAENHSPNSFFQQNTTEGSVIVSYDKYVQDYYINEFTDKSVDLPSNHVDGIAQISGLADLLQIGVLNLHYDNNGNCLPTLNIEDEKNSISELNRLVVFLLSQGKDGKNVLEYVKKLLPKVVPNFDNNGNKITIQDKCDAIFSDIDNLGNLLAYLIYYIDENNFDYDNLKDMLSALHADPLGIIISVLIDKLGPYVIDSLTNEKDYYSEIVFRFWGLRIADLFIDISDYMSEDDFNNLWISTNVRYSSIYHHLSIEYENLFKYIMDSDIANDLFANNDRFIEIKRIREALDHEDGLIALEDFIPMLNSHITYSFTKTLIEELSDMFEGKGYKLVLKSYDNNCILKLDDKTILFANKGNDTVYTGDANSIIYAREGNDIIIAGNGNDKLYGDLGNDIIYGGTGKDKIYGGDGEDTLYGESGDDTIFGGNDDDRIYGGAGVDEIFGEAGNDTIYAGAGEDKIYGGDDVDEIRGGEDRDKIYGDEGDDTLYGDGGRDTIDGGIGNDTLYGNDDNDTLKGREGNDTLNGGFDDDSLRGGDHSDTYHFYKSGGNDNIYDKYGSNTIVFDGVEMSDLTIAYTGTNHQNLLFTITSTNDTLKIIDFKNSADNFKYKFEDDSNYYTIEDNEGVLSFSKIEGNNFGVRYGSHWEKQHDDNGSNNSNRYSSATVAQPPRDPLVIDLGTSGINLSTVEAGVHFDIDKNGFAEKTVWTDGEDGFLVLDRNGNDIIDDGGELFSDHVIMSDGRTSSDGFEALADLDDDHNGIIDEKDSRFADLRVWIDSERDGFSAADELKTLEDLGITSIVLPENQSDPDDDTVEFIKTGSVIFDDGIRDIQEHWFEINGADTQEITVNNVENDLTSFGNMHSLSYALEHDLSGELQTLVDSFKNTDSFIEKRIISRKILYFITGSTDVTVNSRGGTIDARNFHVLEMIMGVDSFVGVNGSTTPNSTAASILNQLFIDFDRTYFNLMNKVLGVADYLEMIEEEPNENGEIVLDLTSVEEVVDHYISLDIDVHEMLYNIGIYVKTYDTTYGTDHLNSFISHYPDYAAEISAMVNGNFALGTDGDDTLNGSSTQDIIWAEDGNDTISTGAGNDIIYGGGGNDTINAGSGDDIVYGGEGNDEITGGDGNDLLYGEENDDIINGNAGNDIIYGGIGNDAITGGTGEDVLYGEDGNDILDGGEDNDVLYGGDGNDSLSGGTGDDILSGGADDDTYIINAEHGNDTIYDSEGLSTLAFGDELSADDYSLHIDINSGISLVNTETEETISIPDFINMPEAYDFTFEGEAQIIGGGSSRQVIEGTDEDDTITAENGFNIIRGGNGDDTITGGDNLDFIYGGNGNDVINGGNGTNIIRGEAGDDAITDGVNDGYLDGGDGNDTIHAGAGNDVIIGGAGVDILYGEDGDDVIAGNEDNDEIYGGNGNDTVYADAGNDTVHGDNGNDSLFGGDGNDTLYGDAGDDYLEAGNGEDTLYGGEGNDVFVGGEGINNMYGEDGDDIFHGGNGINNMYGGDGDDNFTGGELADYIEGGAGNDTMNGGNGNNRMFGNDGDDTIYGGNDDDHIDGGEGNDEVFGGNGVNTIYGGAGNDIIHDGDNDSFLYGGDGDDEIRAGGGSDVLDGGAGNDYLQSDHGGDTYVFGIGYDVDTINASADLNTILIHGYTAADMHNTRMQNNDLVIDFGEDTGDRLVITGFFNFTSNRDFNFTFDDETVLGQHDITAKSAPITGTDDNDYLFGTDGNDIFDGGAGDDSLNGSNGEDTYIFGKGYAHDTINEWGSDHSFVELKDVASDEVTISDQWGSNLLIAVNDTEDVLTISNFKWGQASYTFRFADGAEGYVDKETWQLVLTKQPEPVEEDIEQTNAELLNEIYSDDEFGADIFENDSTIISEVTDSITVSDDTDEVSDMTDIQTMILAENMSAFSDDSNVYDNTNITDITADTSALDQLIVSSVQ